MKAAVVRGAGQAPVYADFAEPEPAAGEVQIAVTAAALTAVLQVALTLAGLPMVVAGLIAAACGFVLRGAAIHWKLGLPAYKGGR